MATIEQMLFKKKIQKRKEEVICKEYKELKAEYPTVPICAIFDTLADKYRRENTNICGAAFPITGQQIRNIVVKHGLYKPRTYNRQED